MQSISLLYTLLKQGMDGKPMVRRAIVVCPTSLVVNWSKGVSCGDNVRRVARIRFIGLRSDAAPLELRRNYEVGWRPRQTYSNIRGIA